MSETAAQPPDARPRNQYKRRRPHRKTRTGCLDCRSRRVKCDEEKPACQYCVRRGVACIYTAEGQDARRVTSDDASSRRREPRTSSRLRDASPSFQTALPAHVREAHPTEPCVRAPSTPSDAPCPSTPTPALDMSALSLLHHWSLSTSLTICHGSDSSEMWQRVFPQIGFSHPFVTHSILSLAALHLAHTHRDDTNVALAASHHNEALRGFRQSAADITEGNSEALFVWSLLNMIYVFGMSTCPSAIAKGGSGDGGSASYKDLVLGAEWIPMIRGIDAVLAPTHNYLRFGRMQKMMSVGNWYDLDPGPLTSEGVDGHLCRTRETWEGSAEAETYDDVLTVLRKCRIFIEQFENMGEEDLAGWGYNRSRSGPLMFIHFAPQAFFKLLHQRQPPALVLFAYFGALLHGIDHYWFVEGWAGKIVELVGDLLGSYWRRWIAWPLEVVGLQ